MTSSSGGVTAGPCVRRTREEVRETKEHCHTHMTHTRERGHEHTHMEGGGGDAL